MTQRQVQVSPFPGIPLLFGENEGAAPSSAVPDEAMEEAERPTVIKRLCQLSSRSPVIGHRSSVTLHLHFPHGILLSWTAGSINVIRGYLGLA